MTTEEKLREALTVAADALKNAGDLRNLGFNECASDPIDADATGVTREQYAAAADRIQSQINLARLTVRRALGFPPVPDPRDAPPRRQQTFEEWAPTRPELWSENRTAHAYQRNAARAAWDAAKAAAGAAVAALAPPATPASDGWVPAGEFPPALESVLVLATVERGCDGLRHVEICWLKDDLWWWADARGDPERVLDADQAVVAWKLMPEPFATGGAGGATTTREAKAP